MYGVHHGYYNQYAMPQSYPAQVQLPQYIHYQFTMPHYTYAPTVMQQHLHPYEVQQAIHTNMQVPQYMYTQHAMPQSMHPNMYYMETVPQQQGQCIQPCTCINCIKTQNLNTTVTSDHTVGILSESHTPTQNIEINVVKSSELLECNVNITVPVSSICRKSSPIPDSIAGKKERTDHEHEGNRTDIEIQRDLPSVVIPTTVDTEVPVTLTDTVDCPIMVESQQQRCSKIRSNLSMMDHNAVKFSRDYFP